MSFLLFLIVNSVGTAVNYFTNSLSVEVGLIVRCITSSIFFVSTWQLGQARRFSCMQWNLFQSAVAYWTWPFLLLTYVVLLPNHPASIYAVGMLPSTHAGLLAHDYIFLFLFCCSVSYGLLSLYRPLDDSFYYFHKESFLKHQTHLTVASFILIIVGIGIMLALPFIPKRVVQLFTLLSWARYWGFTFLVLLYIASLDGSARQRNLAVWFLALGVFFSGFIGFLQGGQKGQLIIQLFLIFLLVLSYRPLRGFRIGMFCFGMLCLLIPFLPHLNTVKNVLGSSIGDSLNIVDRATLVASTAATRDQIYLDSGLANSADYFAYYLIERVSLTHMTAAYVTAYANNPVGLAALLIPIKSAVPRLIDPNKSDMDLYYNEIARVTGIGNYDDLETSRKPSLIEESIYIGGLAGIIGFGLVLGAIFYIIDELLRWKQLKPTVGLAIVVALGMPSTFAYVGVLIGGMPYHLIFFMLCGLIILNPLVYFLDWRQPATLRPVGANPVSTSTSTITRSSGPSQFRRRF